MSSVATILTQVTRILAETGDDAVTIRQLTALLLRSLQIEKEERVSKAYQQGFDAGYEARVAHEQPPAIPTLEAPTP